MKTKVESIQKELEAYIDPVKREYLPNFFKTGKGQYVWWQSGTKKNRLR